MSGSGESDIAVLPEVLCDIGAAYGRSASRVLGLSRGRMAEGGAILPGLVLLSRVTADIRFYVQRRPQETVFFFIKKDGVAEVVINAGVRLGIGIIPEAGAGSDPVALTLVQPSFLESASDDAATLAVGPRGRRRLRLTGLARLEPPPRFSLEPIRVTLDGTPVERVEDPPERGFPWPFEPFDLVLRTLRDQADGGFAEGRERPIDRDELGRQDSDVRRILGGLARAHGDLRARLAAARPVPGGRGQLKDFAAGVDLRVAPDGELSDSFDSGHLTLRVKMEQMLAEPRRLRLSVGPPDFLTGGELLDGFRDALLPLDEFVRQRTVKEVRRKVLNFEAGEEAVESFLRRSFDRGGVMAFRTAQREGGGRTLDEEVLVVEGELGGRPARLLFRALFRVETTPEVKVEYKTDSIRPLTPPGSLEPSWVSDDFVAHLVRLVRDIRTWTRLL